MKYHEILKALIGIPSLSARLDNPFPLVGDKVTISSTSEWVRQHEYLLDMVTDRKSTRLNSSHIPGLCTGKILRDCRYVCRR